MPGAVGQRSLKRKQPKASEKANKRAKPTSDDEDDNSSQDEILRLEQEILESKKNYNNITTILDLAQNGQDDDTTQFALVSLCRVFLRLLVSGNLTRKSGQSEKDGVVVQWLRTRFGDYKQTIISALGQENTAPTALTLAMRVLQAEGKYLKDTDEYSFPTNFLRDVVDKLVGNGSDDIREEFCAKYLGEYADIRFYTFKVLKDILSTTSAASPEESMFDNAFDILSFFEDVPDSVEDMGDHYIDAPKKKGHPVTSLNQQKRQAQEAWLALLKLGPSREQRKRVLQIMTKSIVPWFTKPELLMDFLTDSYDSGGATSLLALSGVFYLIQERNLDYPSFYQKLYSLLDTDILHSKHRSRFIRLLDTFLSSTHLPAALVASFIKRITRLCIGAPPAAIVVVIPWIYNLFKKHPLCTFMMHRVPRTEEEMETLENEGLEDPFIADEEDPMETCAIDSCLWEVVQLQSHYHPNVATIAKIISEQFTKQAYNLEDFLDHSYSSVSQTLPSPQINPQVTNVVLVARYGAV
ncbi:CBF-domain-containing protein [Hypoxylon sp. FL1284]|nr:CBF-domain-containing protein [Hypoxylon sp. FL1284]